MDVYGQHAQCTIDFPQKPKWQQHTLVSKMGILSLAPPPSNKHSQRTPVPHRVRRITQNPTFSTTDPNLTSFLRFPPEVRLNIYRLLLRCEIDLAFPLCPIHPRLVYRPGWTYQNRKRVRHRLFPSILECCRTTYMEGNPILYGENWFHMEPCFTPGVNLPVEQTWPVGRHSLRDITKLTVRVPWHEGHDSRRTVFLQLPLMHSLKIVEFTLPSVSRIELREFLTVTMPHVKHVPQITLEITINAETTDLFHRCYPLVDAKDYGLLCTAGYEPAVLEGKKAPEPIESAGLEGTEARPNRQVSWELKQTTDVLAMSFGLIGSLYVNLTWEGMRRIRNDRLGSDKELVPLY